MQKKHAEIINDAFQLVKDRFETDTTGHDFHHMIRTLNNAKIIQEKEGGDLFIISLAALFHDFPDTKLSLHPELEYERITSWLREKGVNNQDIDHILHCIRAVSYRGGKNPIQPQSIEAKIVQDADRLDALGAIGIARAFTYGGSRGRKMYALENTDEPTTIRHFYEKLLRLKDLMQTKTGKQMAEERTRFMEKFIQQMYKEITLNERFLY